MELGKLELIGSFGVDSGQAMIGDPCYLDDWKKWDDEKEPFDYLNHAEEYGYLGASHAVLTSGSGVLKNEHGANMGVVFQTGYGDGFYPVYAERNSDGTIAHVLVVFTEVRR